MTEVQWFCMVVYWAITNGCLIAIFITLEGIRRKL